MKLYSFPQATLEKAIAKRMMTMVSPHKEWFVDRWSQKPYKKSFMDLKAMPLITFVAKGKTWTDEEFNGELAAWDVKFYDAEVEVIAFISDAPAYHPRAAAYLLEIGRASCRERV